MQPHSVVLPMPYVTVRVTSGIRILLYICASSLQNFAIPPTFTPLSVSLWCDDLGDLVFNCVGLAVLRAGLKLGFTGMKLNESMTKTIVVSMSSYLSVGVKLLPRVLLNIFNLPY